MCVPQYMIGFGEDQCSLPSRRDRVRVSGDPVGRLHFDDWHVPAEPHRGEGHHTEGSFGSTSAFASLAEEARAADAERMQPGDENRLFYKLPVLKRMVIMLGGPTMNLLIVWSARLFWCAVSATARGDE